MKKIILSICIASYNRRDIIVHDVKKYLSLKDDRFIVVVQDDRSTDGAYEELNEIKDPRFVLRKNEINLGGLQNAKAALSNNNTEYVFNLNDKDCIDINYLPTFLDYLEINKPYYGYVDLSNNKPIHFETAEKGIEALKKLSYLCKHPTGFFWRSDLFTEEISKDYYKVLPPKFDYQFDLMYAHCAVRYPGDIVFMPLVINSFMRSELAGNKSYSYSEGNLFFGFNKRKETYEFFLKDIINLDTDECTKEQIQYLVTQRTSGFVTTSLRTLLRHRDVCDHYNLNPRDVSFIEMESNLFSVLGLYRKYAIAYNSKCITIMKILGLLVNNTIKILKMYMKDLYTERNRPLSLPN